MTGRSQNTQLKRRSFLRALLAAAGGAIGVGTWLFWKNSLGRPRRRPNIIFILADDLGYGDLGSYGQERIQTPNLDAMAAQGMRFTDCYAGSAICAPSRCCLMTGLHTGHARIRRTRTVDDLTVPLRPEDVTVAEVLKEAGYVTACIGKWGLGDAGTTGVPNKQGFDEWFGYLSQDHAHNYYPTYLWRNEEKVSINQNEDGENGIYSHDLFTEEALDFIRANRRNPFFLYLAYTIPHAPLRVPDDQPYSDETWPKAERNFASMITRMDSDIGRIASALQELGIDENTIVFFSSDNGPHGQDGHWEHFFDSAGPLRGRKSNYYEGGIRVPMIVWWPGIVEPGRVSDQVWAFWDFLPTAAELAGAELPTHIDIDGISMLPTFLGEEQPEHDFLYWEHFREGQARFDQAVRMGDWKGIWRGPDEGFELYNLREDSGEAQDIADRHPEIVAQIADLMQTARTPSDEFSTNPVPWPGPGK